MPKMQVRIDALRATINRLVARKIHNTFPGYLGVLRTAAAEGKITDLKWDYKEFHDTFLAVRGGPTSKPYYRPMVDVNTPRHMCWLNDNPAGSYAPKSNPGGPFRSVVKVVSNRPPMYGLVANRWKVAYEKLLFSEKVSVVDVAAFLYRDYCLEKKRGTIEVSDLVDVFRDEFGLTAEVRTTGDKEFAALFNDDSSKVTTADWLEEVD